jgi:hypothetical protein
MMIAANDGTFDQKVGPQHVLSSAEAALMVKDTAARLLKESQEYKRHYRLR